MNADERQVMKPFKIWDARRIQRFGCMAANFSSLLVQAKACLGLPTLATVKMVQESDGELMSEENFDEFGSATLLLLKEYESWMPRSWWVYGSRSMPDASGTPLEGPWDVADRSTSKGQDFLARKKCAIDMAFGRLLERGNYKKPHSWLMISGPRLLEMAAVNEEYVRSQLTVYSLEDTAAVLHIARDKVIQYAGVVQVALKEAEEEIARENALPFKKYALEDSSTTPSVDAVRGRIDHLPIFDRSMDSTCAGRNATIDPSGIVWLVGDFTRSTTVLCDAMTVPSLIEQAAKLLRMEYPCRLVLEEDGTEVDDNAFLCAMLSGTRFLLLKSDEHWRFRALFEYDSGTLPVNDWSEETKWKHGILLCASLLQDRIYRTPYPWLLMGGHILHVLNTVIEDEMESMFPDQDGDLIEIDCIAQCKSGIFDKAFFLAEEDLEKTSDMAICGMDESRPDSGTEPVEAMEVSHGSSSEGDRSSRTSGDSSDYDGFAGGFGSGRQSGGSIEDTVESCSGISSTEAIKDLDKSLGKTIAPWIFPRVDDFAFDGFMVIGYSGLDAALNEFAEWRSEVLPIEIPMIKYRDCPQVLSRSNLYYRHVKKSPPVTP